VFRTDGNIFNLRCLQAKTKLHCQVIRELLFADDCVLLVHTENELQQLFDQFSAAARHFGLTVNLKKTQVLLQPATCQNYTTPGIKTDNVKLRVVDKFCYFCGVVSSKIVINDDISSRLSKANVVFVSLSKRLWCIHGISTATTTVLLYCHPFYMVVKDAPCIIITFRNCTSFTCSVSHQVARTCS